MYGLALSVFLACAVEAVEALTIVLAVGSHPQLVLGVERRRAPRSLALAAIVAALGPALTRCRSTCCGRSSAACCYLRPEMAAQGDPARGRPEDAARRLETFDGETEAARAAGARHPGFDGYAFTISFKGVLLEGLEVVLHRAHARRHQHRIPLAAAAPGWPCSWSGRGRRRARAAGASAGEHDEVRGRRDAHLVRAVLGLPRGRVSWPGGDAALLAIVPGVLIGAIAIVWTLRRVTHPTAAEQTVSDEAPDQARERSPRLREQRGRERADSLAARIAQMSEPEQVLDRAQQREVVVGVLSRLPPLMNGDSSSAPTCPPPGCRSRLPAPAGSGSAGCPQQELESAYSPLEGASSTVITSRPFSL